MARQVYRKAALERISSPEQLDKMIVITSPTLWLAVLGGIVIVAAALLWSVFGRLPISVETTGVFVSEQLAHDRGEQKVLCYVPISHGKKIAPGMQVVV